MSNEVAVTLHKSKADLVVMSETPIFEHYKESIGIKSFEEYFHKNLNPDVAPEGFLEQLSNLLEIAKERPLAINLPSCSKHEVHVYNVIKAYIESQ